MPWFGRSVCWTKTGVDVIRSSVQLSDMDSVFEYEFISTDVGIDCGSDPGRMTVESWSNGPDLVDVGSNPTSLGMAFWISGTTGALYVTAVVDE